MHLTTTTTWHRTSGVKQPVPLLPSRVGGYRKDKLHWVMVPGWGQCSEFLSVIQHCWLVTGKSTRSVADWLRFYIALDTKWVISETFFPANLLDGVEKLNLTQQKHAFTNQKKCTTRQNKHKKLKPSLVAFYNVRPGNGESLFLFWRFINVSLTYLLRPTRGITNITRSFNASQCLSLWYQNARSSATIWLTRSKFRNGQVTKSTTKMHICKVSTKSYCTLCPQKTSYVHLTITSTYTSFLGGHSVHDSKKSCLESTVVLPAECTSISNCLNLYRPWKLSTYLEECEPFSTFPTELYRPASFSSCREIH